jgi:hypothetical protein
LFVKYQTDHQKKLKSTVMKKFNFTLLLVIATFWGNSQHRVIIPEEFQNRGEPYPVLTNCSGQEAVKAPLKNSFLNFEEAIGMTTYDNQSHGSMAQRIHVFDDGCIGSVFTFCADYPLNSLTRGTGYNFNNGSGWDIFPEQPLEPVRSGWPSYAPFGENGEINTAHISDPDQIYKGLILLTRENKGEGEWTESFFPGPEGFEDIYWPRMATGGTNHSAIHMMYVTKPESNTQDLYQGQNMAILYSRSTDAGTSWYPENFLIPLIDSSHYLGFFPDIYDMRAVGDNVAMIIGNNMVDLILLKSTDGGTSWEKTIIWEHPYPKWQYWNGQPTDTFYCPDGSHSIDIDADGMVHAVFGINKCYGYGGAIFWFPAVDGVAYWNESRPVFSNNINALNPYGHPDSELLEDYSLVGWMQDINNNGQLEILWDEIALYYLGLSSMPQIYCDPDNDVIVLLFSSVTELFDNGVQNYRHLWMRQASADGNYWGPFVDLNNNLITGFNECVFPSLAHHSGLNGNYHILYQSDYEPGMAMRGDEDPPSENLITYLETDFGVGVSDRFDVKTFVDVSQNYPNPFAGRSQILMKSPVPGDLTIEIHDLAGKKLNQISYGHRLAGTHHLVIESGELKPGTYFYTVKIGGNSVTRKMSVN